jgi:TetR/AcrR family transcriptional regulator
MAAIDGPSSRDKILDVAEERFAQRGFAAVGIQELASAVGMGKSSLFHHFPSKSVLYLAVLDRVLERIDRRVAPVLGADRPPEAKLEGGIDALIDALAEHPPAARLLLRALFEDDDVPFETTPEGRSASARVEALVGSLEVVIRQGVESGAFRPLSAVHAVQTLIGATVYHFASGEFGEELLGRPLFSAEAVRLRREEVKSLFHRGLRQAAPLAAEERR